MRLAIHDIQASSIPGAVGLCASDLPSILKGANEVIQRLLVAPELGDAGWHGTYAKAVFTINPSNPYVTTPRDVARLQDIDICNQPIKVENQFWEFLLFGEGLKKPSCTLGSQCGEMRALDRGTVSTWVDIPAGNTVRVYLTNAADKNKRVFFKAIDSNNNPVYTINNGVQVNGFFVSLDAPFASSLYAMSAGGILGIQKDTTLGPVSIYGVDTAGAQTLLVTLAPNENNPSFRRYFLSNLPSQCFQCGSPTGTVQMTAMAQLEYVPATCDTDYLLIGNLPAIKSEWMAMRLESVDNPKTKAEARAHHKDAIRYLQGELIRYEGKSRPALGFHPFGRNPIALNMT